mgnify:CR=1 FL=1
MPVVVVATVSAMLGPVYTVPGMALGGAYDVDAAAMAAVSVAI